MIFSHIAFTFPGITGIFKILLFFERDGWGETNCFDVKMPLVLADGRNCAVIDLFL